MYVRVPAGTKRTELNIALEDAVAQGLPPDEYEYYYEDEPAAAPAAAR